MKRTIGSDGVSERNPPWDGEEPTVGRRGTHSGMERNPQWDGEETHRGTERNPQWDGEEPTVGRWARLSSSRGGGGGWVYTEPWTGLEVTPNRHSQGLWDGTTSGWHG
ncbi:hypothetical protein NHX12_025430 [Muraenolepis orangiensis]|uniref:Uncharacterized protein n=1 Tax=Muraenolepis orangiensis TaxID=630683 RepID=A0A9Q0IS97_9TELE|nr:hypothetical protein NHX12_025430 [Muraenolepis orangiensis]